MTQANDFLLALVGVPCDSAATCPKECEQFMRLSKFLPAVFHHLDVKLRTASVRTKRPFIHSEPLA